MADGFLPRVARAELTRADLVVFLFGPEGIEDDGWIGNGLRRDA